MKFRLENIGRGKVTRDVDVPTCTHLMRELGKHLRSREIDIGDLDAEGRAEVYAGLYRVGSVLALEPVEGFFGLKVAK